MDTIICNNCEGKGWQLYMDNGCPNQETCEVCSGQKVINIAALRESEWK